MRHVPVVIGHLTVLLGCRACGAAEQISVAVLWDEVSDRPTVDADDADVSMWHNAHRLPYAVAP